jgi:hypothetical protein
MTGGIPGDGVAAGVFMVIGKIGSVSPPQQVWSIEGYEALLRRLGSASGVPLQPHPEKEQYPLPCFGRVSDPSLKHRTRRIHGGCFGVSGTPP